MATNKYPGKCYVCGGPVAPHRGELILFSGKWVPVHQGCVPVAPLEPFECDAFDMQVEDNMRDMCGL